jgi:hypothetical protein
VSHAPERMEKNCLNCGTTVIGRFCHICGQENTEPKETVWQLISHFFNDITHFDGKFFATLKDLLFKPGFLSKEYMNGRRASYLNPVRMYVFTSAIFFLIFFTFFYDKGPQVVTIVNGKTLAEIGKMDSTSFAEFTANINKDNHKPAIPMTREEFKHYFDTAFSTTSGIHLSGTHYNSKKQYDAALAAGVSKDNWFERKLIYKEIELNQEYKNNSIEILTALKNTLIHSLPQMFFISLPLLALILKLFYVRRKQFYYVSHGIFTIHLYIFLFIAMLVLFSFSSMNDSIHWGLLRYISTFLVLGIFVYEYAAMKNFYRQGWVKTFFKFLLTNLLFSVVVGILFMIFIFFSFFNI